MMASNTTGETTFWQEVTTFWQEVQSVAAEWEQKGCLYKGRDDDRPRPWTPVVSTMRMKFMGKHLPPQLREPRTYWYGRTLWKHRRRDQLHGNRFVSPACARATLFPPPTSIT
jgi:hypothetical protein